MMNDTDLNLLAQFDKESFQNPTGIQLKRGAVVLKVGNIYLDKSTKQEHLLIEIIDLDKALFKNLTTLKLCQLAICDIENTQIHNLEQLDITMISDTDWQTAQNRYMAIEPFVCTTSYPFEIKPTYQQRSDEIGIPVRTLKRWVNIYQNNPTLASLLDKKRGWVTGNRRLADEQKRIIDYYINTSYLTPSKPDVSTVIRQIKNACTKQGVTPPSANAVRLSIERIDPAKKFKGRGMIKRAKALFTPKAGHFPQVDFPLSAVQIDHTPMDIILVDDTHRKPIGRPYLTVAIDVYSRMITGYYISLDAPSATSVGMCLVQSILPKDKLLAKFGVDGKWQVFGYPKKIHIDNGADFRSDTLRKSCLIHDIDIEFRPLARPEYGGHIERLIGSLMQQMHRLDGTTFSNIAQKGEYNAEKNATMTLFELEQWLLTYIVKVYHQKIHAGIEMTPSRKWDIGIFGDESNIGLGIPSYPSDELSLTIDFLPYFERTVQTTGVTINGIRYYDPILNNFINASHSYGTASKDSLSGVDKQKFIFRQDPRDISSVWFLDPITKHYFNIPYANQALPQMSVWQFNQLKKQLKSKNGVVDEHSLIIAYDELKKITENASFATKKARRQQARAKHHKQTQNYANATPKTTDEKDLNAGNVGQPPIKPKELAFDLGVFANEPFYFNEIE